MARPLLAVSRLWPWAAPPAPRGRNGTGKARWVRLTPRVTDGAGAN
jgi:hypothetical protein